MNYTKLSTLKFNSVFLPATLELTRETDPTHMQLHLRSLLIACTYAHNVRTLVCSHTHAHAPTAHMYIYAHHLRTNTNSYMQILNQPHAPLGKDACSLACLHTLTRAVTFMYAHSWVHTFAYTLVNTHSYKHTRECTFWHRRTRMHNVYTQPRTHT